MIRRIIEDIRICITPIVIENKENRRVVMATFLGWWSDHNLKVAGGGVAGRGGGGKQ